MTDEGREVRRVRALFLSDVHLGMLLLDAEGVGPMLRAMQSQTRS